DLAFLAKQGGTRNERQAVVWITRNSFLCPLKRFVASLFLCRKNALDCYKRSRALFVGFRFSKLSHCLESCFFAISVSNVHKQDCPGIDGIGLHVDSVFNRRTLLLLVFLAVINLG